jgi:hypothetical protein
MELPMARSRRRLSKATLTRKDLSRIRKHGQTVRQVLRTFQLLQRGTVSVHLVEPCSLGDGIIRIRKHSIPALLKRYEEACADGRIGKFVSSSGAATRMFRFSLGFRGNQGCTREYLTKESEAGNNDARDLLRWMNNLARTAIFPGLVLLANRSGFNVEKELASGRYDRILEALFDTSGLALGDCPKGLIPFHTYPDGVRTPLQEHLIEAARYIKDHRGIVRVHFTARPEHASIVGLHLRHAKKRFFTAATFRTTVSIQEFSTDSPALDSENVPVRNQKGDLVFFPGGHGALLPNLNRIRGDVLFIRTIDNIFPERLQEVAIWYRKILAGYLLELQETSFRYLRILESECAADDKIDEICALAETNFSIRFPAGFFRFPRTAKMRWLFKKLNRPLRVCGVVRHGGEVGGGPFWVKDRNQNCSIQMIEGAQVDAGDPEQLRIWNSSGFFNAADLVCGLRDFRGRLFDLEKYADSRAALLVTKSVAGRPVKLLEKPGLWNGGMANWNSVFVQIPRSVLHPVKSILDLLDARHKP